MNVHDKSIRESLAWLVKCQRQLNSIAHLAFMPLLDYISWFLSRSEVHISFGPERRQKQMATKTGFTAHETIGVHEALRCRALGLTKMQMMQPMIQDAELKRFLAQEITASIQEVQQLETWAHQITP